MDSGRATLRRSPGTQSYSVVPTSSLQLGSSLAVNSGVSSGPPRVIPLVQRCPVEVQHQHNMPPPPMHEGVCRMQVNGMVDTAASKSYGTSRSSMLSPTPISHSPRVQVSRRMCPAEAGSKTPGCTVPHTR